MTRATYKQDPPAFPVTPGVHWEGHIGMSLRDYFAGQALAGLCASNMDGMPDAFAKASYAAADAMLAHREADQ